jgi:hypothetical protein
VRLSFGERDAYRGKPAGAALLEPRRREGAVHDAVAREPPVAGAEPTPAPAAEPVRGPVGVAAPARPA